MRRRGEDVYVSFFVVKVGGCGRERQFQSRQSDARKGERNVRASK